MLSKCAVDPAKRDSFDENLQEEIYLLRWTPFRSTKCPHFMNNKSLAAIG